MPVETPRGFTGHEHLDKLGLIHMNGRVYDPELGRFLSADPIVQFPETTQGFNRYSYVLNNPLSATDPSGFFLKMLFKMVRAIALPLYKPLKKLENRLLRIKAVQIVGYAVASYYGGPWGAAIFAARVAEANGGDESDMFRAAVIAGTTATFSGVVSAYASPAVGIVAHGVVGGMSSELQGGSFKSGFLTGSFSAASGSVVDGIPGRGFDSIMARTMAASVAGGLGAKLGGGKFKNGAITGAFSRLFNDEVAAHRAGKRSAEVIVFEPVGEGRSSLGHAALNIDGTVYSFGEDGMWVGSYDVYMERNSFRWGVGYQLNLTDAQISSLECFVSGYDASFKYVYDVCTTPIREGLASIGGCYYVATYSSSINLFIR